MFATLKQIRFHKQKLIYKENSVISSEIQLAHDFASLEN